MTLTLIATVRARRQLSVEKKRMKDEMRKLRYTRLANKTTPAIELIHSHKPAA